MTIITKAALAAELGVSKARVSQYVKRGLPVRADGRIDREDAVKWIAASHVDYGRGTAAGVKRANVIARSIKPVAAKPLNPQPDALSSVDAVLLNGLAEIVGRSGACAARAALDAGASVRTAFAIELLVAVRLGEAAETILDDAGVCRHEDALNRAAFPVEQREALDWSALAAGAGETFDEDEWHSAADALIPDPAHG